MTHTRKPLKILVFIYLCSVSIWAWAQNPDGLDKSLKDRISDIQTRQAQEEKQIDNTVLQLSAAANSMCILQAFSFHWYFIRIVSYHDTTYLPCDASQYVKLSPNSVLAQMRTLPNAPYYVILPGIHFLTMDVIKTGMGFNYINVGTIRFFPIAISEISLWDIIRYPSRFKAGVAYGRAYTPVRTRENTYLRWNPGNTIVYLTSPEGNAYVMTSYTSSLVPSLKRSNLDQLGSFMNLPPGWTFRSKKLTKVLEVHSKQIQGMETTRLTDEYQNIYIEVDLANINRD